MGIRDRLADLGRQAAISVLDAAKDRLEKSGITEEELATPPPAGAAPPPPPEPAMVEVRPPAWEFDGSPDEIAALQKANAQMVPADQMASREPKAMFWDPFSLVEQLGFKEKPTAITYGTLSAMVWKTTAIQAVIQTRLSQMARFCRLQRNRHQMGFKVRSRNPNERLGKAAKKEAERIEMMLLRGGNVQTTIGRDGFGDFTKKCMWDSLVYDQTCFEVVPDRMGRPAEWYAVDAATIRLADTPELYWNPENVDHPRTVQIYDNMIISEWPAAEMAFCVRNPRTAIRNHGYGTSELEMLVHVITSMLWAFQYNQKMFSQGLGTKGILNIKGTVPDRHMRAFRRHFYQMAAGVENAHRTPVTNAEGMEWINLQNKSEEMGYSAWFDFLIKLACAVYLMDPAEVNFKYGNTGQRTMFEAANKQKLIESRDKGLAPLLQWWSEQVNCYIVHPLNEDLSCEFLGLDAQTPQELADLNEKRVKTYMTVDELREESDLEPMKDGKGDVILDPTWMQFQQAKEMMAQQGEGGGGFDFGGGNNNGGLPGPPGGTAPPNLSGGEDYTQKAQKLLPPGFSDEDSTFEEEAAAAAAMLDEDEEIEKSRNGVVTLEFTV